MSSIVNWLLWLNAAQLPHHIKYAHLSKIKNEQVTNNLDKLLNFNYSTKLADVALHYPPVQTILCVYRSLADSTRRISLSVHSCKNGRTCMHG